MSGNVSNFVRGRNDNPQSNQDSHSAVLARRQAAAAHAKVINKPRQVKPFHQSQQSLHFSGHSLAPQHWSQPSFVQDAPPEMRVEDHEQNFLDSEVGSDFDNTMVVDNNSGEDERQHPSDNSDDDMKRYGDHDQMELPPINQQDSAYVNAGFHDQYTNRYPAPQGENLKSMISSMTKKRPGQNQVPGYAQIVSDNWGASPNTMNYSGRFHGVASQRLELEGLEVDQGHQASSQQYQPLFSRNHHHSRAEAGQKMEQSQLNPSQNKQPYEQPGDPSSEESDSAESPSHNRHRNRSERSTVAGVSSHNGIPDSDPPENLEDSRHSNHAQLKPQGNHKIEILTEPLEEMHRLKRTAAELDYNEDALYKMNYSELKGQDFDNDPRASTPLIPEALSGPDISVQERLRHFANQTPDLQSHFFSQMPIEDWEEAGDWFLTRFGDITSKLREARRERREVSKKFEEELATREDTVQGKIEGIDQVLAKMKQGGKGVLQLQHGSTRV